MTMKEKVWILYNAMCELWISYRNHLIALFIFSFIFGIVSAAFFTALGAGMASLFFLIA